MHKLQQLYITFCLSPLYRENPIIIMLLTHLTKFFHFKKICFSAQTDHMAMWTRCSISLPRQVHNPRQTHNYSLTPLPCVGFGRTLKLMMNIIKKISFLVMSALSFCRVNSMPSYACDRERAVHTRAISKLWLVCLDGHVIT